MAPSYLDRHGTPACPNDLRAHRCLQVRVGDGSLYRWEFQGPDGEFAVPVRGRVTIDETRAMLSVGLTGLGPIQWLEPIFAPPCAKGKLRPVPQNRSTTSPGYHIDYSSRRQLPAALRLLTETIRELRPPGL